MASVLSSPTPSLPSNSVPIITPPLLGSPELIEQDAVPPSSPPSSSSPSSTSASEPSTPTGPHHAIVPSYPYNVAMVPAAVNGGPLPDDSELTTRLPSICVDYLSHDWAEDDVWTSWKAMTRHKAEIANGVRLENASWRTWAKQRGKLKTVSPETLNWLKDSDVTWLYGPLHTAVEAVPPPKEATANERLGLEPLRSLSDVKGKPPPKKEEKREVAPAPVPALQLQQRRGSKADVKTKPILKYRSLSDILMPQGQPTSPVIEQLGMDFEDQATISVHHARSDSHLVRLNSLNRKVKRSSPIHSPGSSSPERTASDSSSASTFLRNAQQKKRDRRHISFNHRVEQCIAIDSADERPYSTAASSSDDDDDDVLTFGARSPRHNSFARQPPKPEPHTIARLGPTTLKSVELYPAPSPAVVFASDPTEYDDAASSPPEANYGQHVETYDPGRVEQQRQQQVAGQRAMYDYQNTALRSQWDPEDEDDYGMGGFDYFTPPGGPDVGMGDEYDMAQYGSAHLVGGSHNNYRGGSVSDSASYLGGGPYSPSSPYGPSNPAALDPSSHASSQIPHYRDSQPSSSSTDSSSPASPASSSGVASPPLSTASPGARGPHSPSASRDTAQPKRSSMKGGRSRESSVESSTSSLVSSPTSSSTLNASSSPPTGIQAVATAIPAHVRPGGIRRTNSDDGSGNLPSQPQERGRSASRGSSSSLEREASANRRSSSSISPNSSYSPPISAQGFGLGASGTYGSPASTAAGAAAKPIAIQPRSGSYDSLGSVMSGGAAGRGGYLPGVPEASASEEKQGDAAGLGRIVTSSSVDSMGSLGSFGQAQTPTSPTMSLPSPSRSRFAIPADDDDDDAMVEDVAAQPNSRPAVGLDEVDMKKAEEAGEAAAAPKAPPPASSSSAAPPTIVAPTPAAPSSSNPASLGHSRTPSLPRLRNASPSTAGQSSPSQDGHGSPAEPTLAKTPAVPSPPIPHPPQQSEQDDAPALKRTSSSSSVHSYARSSLLRAARASSDSGASASQSRERERPSLDSQGGRSVSDHAVHGDHDYAFGDDDFAGAGAGVGRGIDVAGTARDLLGAISKGIWGSLGGSGGASGGAGGGGAGGSAGRSGR
ncbi:hypothetical protein JCM10207_001150 [Rhodosporidiobolus poonsookiae]